MKKSMMTIERKDGTQIGVIGKCVKEGDEKRKKNLIHQIITR